MYFYKKIIILILSLMLFSSRLHAEPATLVVPTCLLSNAYKYQVLGKSEDLWLVQINDTAKFQKARLKHSLKCRGFLNVNAAYNGFKKRKEGNAQAFLQQYTDETRPSDFTRGYKIQYQTVVNQFATEIDSKKMQDNLLKWTGIFVRSSNGERYQSTALWLKHALLALINHCTRHDATLYTVPIVDHSQSSIILRIGGGQTSPGIVLGAHFDALQSDGASAVSLLEAARILLTSEQLFEKPIYLIWYAGEEAGKLGSQSVVNYFNEHTWLVDSVLALSQTGVMDKERGVGLADEATDASLSAYVADLITFYLKLPIAASSCGFACSEHIIWYQNGNRIAAAMGKMDADNHLKYENKMVASMAHMQDFVKLALAFAVELAQPVPSLR